MDIQVPFFERILEAAGRAPEPPAGRALSINGLAEGFYTHEFAIYWVFAALQSCFIESDSLIYLFLRWF